MVYDSVEEAVRAAREILDGNWTGSSTVPGRGLYPHQWAWDSGLIALGYARYAPGRARQELRSLFRGQWKNGMLPHIVFDPDAPDYFPGYDFWKCSENPNYPGNGVETSGCVQPPVHATAVRCIYENSDDKGDARAFVEELYPKLLAWHDYLYRERDPHGEALVCIRHPWESGRDNSPVWDEILARIQFDRDSIPDYQRADTDDWRRDGRPSNRTYDCYVYLCQLFKQAHYDEAELMRTCPFLVQDLLFNTILCQAGQDIAALAEIIGDDPAPLRDRAERTGAAMRSKLWREQYGVFLPWDLASDRPLSRHEIGGFSPLYAGVPTQEQAGRMRKHLDSRYFADIDGSTCRGLTSYSRADIDYDPGNYWRGPVWININWLIAKGLARYGFEQQRRQVMHTVRTLPLHSGFREHYNPETGQPQGAVNFSWSAALYIDAYHAGEFDG